MGDENPIRTLRDYSKPSHVGYQNTIELLGRNNVVPLRPNTTRRTIKNVKEYWALLEDLALYDNKSWNDPWDFPKPVKIIYLPHDIPSTSDRHLIELENQYCMKNPEQAFVDYASSRTDEAGVRSMPSQYVPSNQTNPMMIGQKKKGKKRKETTPSSPPDLTILFITDKVRKLNSFLESSGLVPRSSDIKFVCTKEDDEDVMFIEIIKKYYDSREHKLEEDENAMTRGLGVEYFFIFPTRSKLVYHKYLMSGLITSMFIRSPIIVGGRSSNLKIPCNIGHVHVKKAYIDLNSPLNIMTEMMYNWIMRRKLDPREDPNRGVSNFTRRIKGMHIFVGNFTYVLHYMIVEDIISIIDPRLSQVVLGKHFVEISNMTYDLSLGVVRFTNMIDEITYNMPHKIEQYNSLSYLEKEYTKSIYFRNVEDKRRGVDYAMSKILRFYKECLELGPEYFTTLEDEGGVT
uniref:MAK10-like protein n=1 Tax=Tanacetum cinerariifolium TaxID=118510 RepID=A0A6L2KSW7_TANCI|nr:MAK10-like protein [Tanacetum cinerariifolium]